MSETKAFDVRTVMSVTTGRLVTKGDGPRDNGIGDMYKLLGWMTDDSPFTHQLDRFAEECKPWLYRWFPELEKAESAESLAVLDELLGEPGADGDTVITTWLRRIGQERWSYDIPKIPRDDHTARDPVAELVEMRGGTEGVVRVVAGAS